MYQFYPYRAFQPVYPGGPGAPSTTVFPPQVPSGSTIPGIPTPGQPIGGQTGQLPLEQSFIENILRLNLGKMATVYMTFENNTQWNAKIFRGVIEAAGRDHLIISDRNTGTRYLLLMVNLDYITFDEPLNYFSPHQVR